MSSSHSKIIIVDPNTTSVVQENTDQRLYRYMDNPSDCQNFINGNIWFSGTNNNRTKHNDPSEHIYKNHTRLFCSTLSLTFWPPDRKDDMHGQRNPFYGRPCIEVHNLPEMLSTIKRGLLDYAGHQVSWLDKNYLAETAEKENFSDLVALARNIEIIPSDGLSLQVLSIRGTKMSYYGEEQVTPLTIPATQRASCLHKKHQNEEEYRIELNTTAFFSQTPRGRKEQDSILSLHQLIEYIKLQGPSLNDFCRLILE